MSGGVGSAEAGSSFGKSLGPVGDSLVSNLAGGFAGAATTSLLSHTDFGSNLLNSIPNAIGQTIGNALAYQISQGSNSASQANNAPKAGASTTDLNTSTVNLGPTHLPSLLDSLSTDPYLNWSPGTSDNVPLSGDGAMSGESVSYSFSGKITQTLSNLFHTGDGYKIQQAINLIASTSYSQTQTGAYLLGVIQRIYNNGNIQSYNGGATIENGALHGTLGETNNINGNPVISVDSRLFNDPVALATILVHEATHAAFDITDPNHYNSGEEEAVAYEHQLQFYAQV